MVKINELRSTLIAAGYAATELDGVKKSDLAEMVEALKNANTTLSTEVHIGPSIDEAVVMSPNPTIMDEIVVPVVTETKTVDEKETVKSPTPGDKEWSDYILGQLDESEMINGCPKSDGLRRIATLMYGRFTSDTTVVQVPTQENGFRATVSVSLAFPSCGLRVSGSADVFEGNTDHKFSKYPVATAETRAKGRALREVLLLQNVVVAEELDQQAAEDEPNGKIDSGMLNGIQAMAKRNGVDLLKLALVEGYSVSETSELTYLQGKRLVNLLNKYQNKKETIPDAIKSVG